MASPSALPPEMHQALARGAILLTANQRAARSLRRAFDLDQRATGTAAWQPPQILAWESWLGVLWKALLLEGHASALLLSSNQENSLWRAIIVEESAVGLRPVDALATTAAGAWLLLHTFCRRYRLREYAGNSDTRVFVHWAAQFESRCRRWDYLTQAELPEALRVAVSTGHIHPPRSLLMVGFDAFTPAQEALLDALRDAGTTIDRHWVASEQTTPTAQRELIAAATEANELEACARWLRARLIEQPAAQLAVIVPAIAAARAGIDRAFRRVLSPELNDIAAAERSSPYEFSLGVPLATTPMIRTALDLLRWPLGPLALDRISALLLSPHFAAGDGPERLARAEFDAFVLRRQSLLQPQMSLHTLRALVEQSPLRDSLPALLHCLRALGPVFAKRQLDSSERTHADWAATNHGLLDAAGWAPLAGLDSIEFQTRRKWESALDELATLDFDDRRVTFADALAALERITAETLFAPESRYTPVQILGPLESAGSTFDAIWFLGAGDLSWPRTPATNPLLPWALQRDLAMPGADPAADATRARRITERIAASAPRVVFSYSQQSGESRQRPSSTLAGLPLDRAAAEVAPEPAHPAIALEAVLDDTPIPPPPDRVLRGGAAILKAQAACGFRAFAERRLFASALDPVSLGLDAAERGSLIHAVLEGFWAEIKTQAALLRMTSAERDAQLLHSINDAFSKHHSRPAAGWPQAYLDTERRRMMALLGHWLDYEAAGRPAFTVKAREEKLADVRIGPLRLDIRVDRVDQIDRSASVDMPDNAMPDNADTPPSEVILDYKTGLADPSAWLGDRPDEPQLPLYAVVADSANLAAVAFATLRPGKEMTLRGLQSQPGILSKSTKLKSADLDAQIDQWRDVLTALAEEFHAGHAHVSPKKYPQTCSYCAQRLLCRLDPAALEVDTLDDSEEETELTSGEAYLG